MNINEGAFTKVNNGYKILIIFAKKLDHRCFTWF